MYTAVLDWRTQKQERTETPEVGRVNGGEKEKTTKDSGSLEG